MFVRSVQILLQFDKILWRSAIFWMKYFVYRIFCIGSLGLLFLGGEFVRDMFLAVKNILFSKMLLIDVDASDSDEFTYDPFSL